MINTYKDLIVWQKSMKLAKEVYILTEKFPKSEMFGISSQMRRATVSIPSNIAEGFVRKHRKEFSQFISIAFGSGAELETQIEISKILNFVRPKDYEQADLLLIEVMKMLNKLNSTLKTSR
jgi:four helix bundle protein